MVYATMSKVKRSDREIRGGRLKRRKRPSRLQTPMSWMTFLWLTSLRRLNSDSKSRYSAIDAHSTQTRQTALLQTTTPDLTKGVALTGRNSYWPAVECYRRRQKTDNDRQRQTPDSITSMAPTMCVGGPVILLTSGRRIFVKRCIASNRIVMWHRPVWSIAAGCCSTAAVAVIDFLLRKAPQHWLPALLMGRTNPQNTIV